MSTLLTKQNTLFLISFTFLFLAVLLFLNFSMYCLIFEFRKKELLIYTL